MGLSTLSHLRPVHFVDVITVLFPAPLDRPALVTGARVIVQGVPLAIIAPDVTRRPMMGRHLTMVTRIPGGTPAPVHPPTLASVETRHHALEEEAT